MATNHRAEGKTRSAHHGLRGPRAAFLGAVLTVGLCWTLAPAVVGEDLITPAATSLLFALAAVFAGVALSRRGADEDDVTFWDVAGAMTLIGICMSALIAPDQLVRFIADAGSRN